MSETAIAATGGSMCSTTPGGGETVRLCDREAALLTLLEGARGRVVTRTELARAAGLRQAPRRVDVHLVNVRRHLQAATGNRLVNVRGRGWMLLDEDLVLV